MLRSTAGHQIKIRIQMFLVFQIQVLPNPTQSQKVVLQYVLQRYEQYESSWCPHMHDCTTALYDAPCALQPIGVSRGANNKQCERSIR